MYDAENKIVSMNHEYMMSDEKIDISIPDNMLSPSQRANRSIPSKILPPSQEANRSIPSKVLPPTPKPIITYKYIKYSHDKEYCIGYDKIGNDEKLYVKKCERDRYMFAYIDKKIVLRDNNQYCISYGGDHRVVILECKNSRHWIITDNIIIFEADKRFCLDLVRNTVSTGIEVNLGLIEHKFTQEVEFTSDIEMQFPWIGSGGKCDISNGQHIISQDGNWKLRISGFGDPIKYHKENGRWISYGRNDAIFPGFNIMEYGGPKDRKCPYKLKVDGIGMCIHNRDDDCMWHIEHESSSTTSKLVITNNGEIKFTLLDHTWQDGKWIR
jgi:hypothetical protein